MECSSGSKSRGRYTRRPKLFSAQIVLNFLTHNASETSLCLLSYQLSYQIHYVKKHVFHHRTLQVTALRYLVLLPIFASVSLLCNYNLH